MERTACSTVQKLQVRLHPMLSGLRWPGQTVMGSWLPALKLERERTQGRTREKFYIYLDVSHTYTHTHTPGRSRVNPERQEEEKSGHRTGRRPKTAQGGEGNRRTSRTNLHGETDLTKTAHTPKPHNTLRRGTRGKLGTIHTRTHHPLRLLTRRSYQVQDSGPRNVPVVSSNRSVHSIYIYMCACTFINVCMFSMMRVWNSVLCVRANHYAY